MWRVTTVAATRGLLSAGRASTKPTLDFSSVSFSCPRISSSVDGLAGGGAALLFALRLHSAVDPLTPRLERASAAFSTASPAEAAAMLGSLAPASSSVSQMSMNVSEAIRHYGRCYWELSKARLRGSYFQVVCT
ncbi:protoheme IX farnesyltransferase [Musa troglodytarum]|uniref:Protoheme IX farnesyltransferase n=1 Tax=Musa troglodytarum TaxID=320322 RepID=A0A9E7JJY5_9LILI|nr:protoheme IX farnesyltransferase [Musa troglodytarum]